MNDQVAIKCQKCLRDFDVARLKLSAHWGKKVEIKCKHCKQPNQLNVNALLMSGKSVSNSAGESNVDFTIHLNPSDTIKGIAKLLVVPNEYNNAQAFLLKEGENLIGRQSAKDSEIKNKIGLLTNDTKLSRIHCQITVMEKPDKTYRYVLEDMGSLNGTHIEVKTGMKKLEKNEKIVIQVGDIVSLGYRTKIKLSL